MVRTSKSNQKKNYNLKKIIIPSHRSKRDLILHSIEFEVTKSFFAYFFTSIFPLGNVPHLHPHLSGIINLSKNRPSKQSSTFGNFKSKYANDGQLLGSISSTLKQWNPWWEVNFKKMSVVNLVKIYLPIEHYLHLNSYMDLLLIYHPTHWYVWLFY